MAVTRFTNNIQFVENLIDWSVEDMELLSIRTSGVFARTLRPIGPDEALRWEYGCYGFAAAALALVAWIPRRRRNRVRPIATPPASDGAPGAVQ